MNLGVHSYAFSVQSFGLWFLVYGFWFFLSVYLLSVNLRNLWISAF
jgi:hypothetical protein